MDAKRFNYGSADLQHSSDNLQGTLLISTELQQGSPFEKAVVLLMQDDKRGSFGVALNKVAEPKVRSAWEKLTGAETNDQHVVVSGGPLQGPVFAIHQIPALSDVAMPGGLHVSAQIENLQQLMMQFDDPYRIIVGVSGWKPGQLISELDSGYWYSMPLDPEAVFDDPKWMWEICLHEYGRHQIADIVGEDNIPDDPDLN